MMHKSIYKTSPNKMILMGKAIKRIRKKYKRKKCKKIKICFDSFQTQAFAKNNKANNKTNSIIIMMTGLSKL